MRAICTAGVTNDQPLKLPAKTGSPTAVGSVLAVFSGIDTGHRDQPDTSDHLRFDDESKILLMLISQICPTTADFRQSIYGQQRP